ncbi:MAG: DUF305 domain-containing protein [Moraxella sp.]
MARFFDSLLLAALMLGGVTACKPQVAMSDAAASAATSEPEFEEKLTPQVLDPQAINKNMVAVSQLTQTFSTPAASAVNDYQQAYFTVIDQPASNRERRNYAAASLGQFDYLPMTPDVIFVKTILNHFAETVALARIEKRYGSDPTLLHLADDVIASRQNEAQIMQNWLSMQLIKTDIDANQTLADSVAAQQEIDSVIHDMQQEMVDTVMTKNADRAFAQTLVIHHKGAIALSQVVLKYGYDEKVRSLTNTLIDSQQAEIQVLQTWLNSHGNF